LQSGWGGGVALVVKGRRDALQAPWQAFGKCGVHVPSSGFRGAR